MEQPRWNINFKETLRLPICSFIKLSEVTRSLLIMPHRPPPFFFYNLVSTNYDLSAEHSHQTWGKAPEMKPGNDLHSLVFNFLPTTRMKRISHATHLFIFIRPNGRRALSQRESPSNVVTLTEKPAGRRSFVASVLCALAWIIAQLVYGGSSSAGHYLEILLLERIIHGVIRMSPYVLNSWY